MSGTRASYDSVEDSLYSVGHHNSAVPLKTQAARLGMSAAKLTDYVDPTRKPRFPADLVAPHAIAAENFAAVQTICNLAGGVFIQIPTGHGDAAEVAIELGAAIKEAGEIAMRVGRHLCDGVLDSREAADSLPDAAQAVAAFARLYELLKKKAEAK